MLAVLLTLALFAGCASGAGAPVSTTATNDKLIVPFKRIGPIYLGMLIADARNVLGAPTSAEFSNARPGFGAYSWGNHFRATVLDGRKIESVGTSEPEFRTREGTGIGSTEVDLRAGHGTPRRRMTHREGLVELRYPGVLFRLEDGRVTLVQVFDD